MNELNKESYQKLIENSKTPVLVDFWAPWCGPCKMLAPVLDDVAAELGKKVEFAKFNVDDDTDFIESLNIFSVPSLFIYKNGEVVEKLIGLRNKDNIVATLNKYL